MVLGGRPPGRVGRRRISHANAPAARQGAFVVFRPSRPWLSIRPPMAERPDRRAPGGARGRRSGPVGLAVGTGRPADPPGGRRRPPRCAAPALPTAGRAPSGPASRLGRRPRQAARRPGRRRSGRRRDAPAAVAGRPAARRPAGAVPAPDAGRRRPRAARATRAGGRPRRGPDDRRRPAGAARRPTRTAADRVARRRPAERHRGRGRRRGGRSDRAAVRPPRPATPARRDAAAPRRQPTGAPTRAPGARHLDRRGPGARRGRGRRGAGHDGADPDAPRRARPEPAARRRRGRAGAGRWAPSRRPKLAERLDAGRGAFERERYQDARRILAKLAARGARRRRRSASSTASPCTASSGGSRRPPSSRRTGRSPARPTRTRCWPTATGRCAGTTGSRSCGTSCGRRRRRRRWSPRAASSPPAPGPTRATSQGAIALLARTAPKPRRVARAPPAPVVRAGRPVRPRGRRAPGPAPVPRRSWPTSPASPTSTERLAALGADARSTPLGARVARRDRARPARELCDTPGVASTPRFPATIRRARTEERADEHRDPAAGCCRARPSCGCCRPATTLVAYEVRTASDDGPAEIGAGGVVARRPGRRPARRRRRGRRHRPGPAPLLPGRRRHPEPHRGGGRRRRPRRATVGGCAGPVERGRRRRRSPSAPARRAVDGRPAPGYAGAAVARRRRQLNVKEPDGGHPGPARRRGREPAHATSPRASRRTTSSCPGPDFIDRVFVQTDRIAAGAAQPRAALQHGPPGRHRLRVDPAGRPGHRALGGGVVRAQPGVLRPGEHRGAGHRGRLQRGGHHVRGARRREPHATPTASRSSSS